MSCVDSKIFNQIKDVMKDKMTDMVIMYLEDTSNYIEQITKGIAEDNIDDVIIAAHTIKSSSNQLGALAIGALAMSMEHKGKMAKEAGLTQVESASELLMEIKACYQKTKLDLDRLVSATS